MNIHQMLQLITSSNKLSQVKNLNLSVLEPSMMAHHYLKLKILAENFSPFSKIQLELFRPSNHRMTF